MPPFVYAIIAALIVHYFLAIFTIYLLLKDMGIVKAVIPWNLVILLLPIAGPLSYLIYRSIKQKK